MSQPRFDPCFENIASLATMKCCDTTKQFVCGWLHNVYIYIYIYVCVCVCVCVCVHACAYMVIWQIHSQFKINNINLVIRSFRDKYFKEAFFHLLYSSGYQKEKEEQFFALYSPRSFSPIRTSCLTDNFTCSNRLTIPFQNKF